MLYRINHNTLLDLPKWKCRREFADFYRAKIENPNDVDLLCKLKAKCDEIEKLHIRKIQHNHWKHPHRKSISVYDMNGNYITTHDSSYIMAFYLFGGTTSETRRQVQCINQVCRNPTRYKSYKGFQFKYSDGSTSNMDPYEKRICMAGGMEGIKKRLRKNI